MNLEHINVFIVVVETGNLSAAAQTLYTSQSNISRKISQLESEVGIPLIYRSKGQQSIELTAAGYEFLDYARQIQSLTKDIDSIAKNINRKFGSSGVPVGKIRGRNAR